MFLLILFSGFITFTVCVPQYLFVNESKTWTEAQRYCREKYTDLATVTNEQQTLQLIDTVNDNSIDLAWIGLYDDVNIWKWTLEDRDFFKVGERDFRNWNNPGPNNYGSQYLCVIMNNGLWYPTVCGSYYFSVCYDGRENASATYVIIPKYQTWTVARKYCREHHTDLVSIRNEVENQNVFYLLRDYPTSDVWIGLYRTQSWSDQSNSSFSNWWVGPSYSGGSSKYCTAAFFSDSGKWKDEKCNTELPFICYSASASSRQYQFVFEFKNWTEAQKHCRQNYTDLATIENMEEMNSVIDAVNGSYSGAAWIGLYDDLNSWKWSLEDQDFYQEGERDFRNWYQEPDNNGGNQMCVYMDVYGKWFDFSCDFSAYFACYDGNSTQTYIKSIERKNWTEARRHCREHYTDLVNVRNQTENQRILESVGGGIWIGLYRYRIWSNSQTTSYQNWRPQISSLQMQPDNGANIRHESSYQHCTAVSFRYSGRWTDEICDNSLPFFCYNRSCTQSSCAHQYHFVFESKTWSEAQTYCRQNYIDLATIDNMEEMNSLIKTVRSTYYGLTWIGLYEDVNSWRWSLDNAALGGFRSWYVQKPLNSGGRRLCAYMSYNQGIWSEFSCSYRLFFVCYDGSANATTRYVLVEEYKNWTEAQSYCREHHTDLISIRDEMENYRIQKLITYFYTLWIGLYRTRSWSDKSNSSFSNWKEGQPDNAGDSEYCTAVSFSDSGRWTDEQCNTQFPFICYRASASSRQYQFVFEFKNWTEAQKHCRQYYTDLATIENMEEMNSVIDAVNGSYSGAAWIGLYDDLDSWRWSLEDQDFYQEGERDFRNWYHEPNNQNGNELCVYMDYNGNWIDYSCESTICFVCYDGRAGASQRYVVVYKYKTWTEAQSFCRQNFTDLASVRDEAERQQILSLTHTYIYGVFHGTDVWIGLQKHRQWSDQSSSSFTYWLPSTQSDPAQPDNGLSIPGQVGVQHCTAVSLQHFGQWTDERCLATLPFFCYSEQLNPPTFSEEYVVGLRVGVKSVENLSKSQIEKLVIIQLEKLVRLGLPSNVTMNVRSSQKNNP